MIVDSVVHSSARTLFTMLFCRQTLQQRLMQQRPFLIGKPYLPPANESLRRLCFYTRLSVILFTGGCLPSAYWDTPPDQRQTPPGVDTPQSSACWEIRATSGQYASYWNAYLLVIITNNEMF